MQGADLKKQFGKRLKFIREIENLTQAGLAAAVGVTEQYLSMLERGLSSPSFDVISRLCACLGVDPAGLFLFNEVAPPDGAGDEPLRQDWGSHLTRMGLLDVDLPDGPGRWSVSLRELLGLPRSAPDPGLAGLEAMVPPEDRAAFRRDWALLISGAAAPCLECRLVRHDGVERW
ncbi:MAG: helix-turn-helix domain-containing protein, partial [Desulfovibrionaceae bacterium]